jgi:hypothetical protein
MPSTSTSGEAVTLGLFWSSGCVSAGAKPSPRTVTVTSAPT